MVAASQSHWIYVGTQVKDHGIEKDKRFKLVSKMQAIIY